MKKTKILITILLLLIAMFVIPTFVRAETLTYKDTEQGIDWTYQLDSNNNIKNLKSTTTSKTGAVTVPSTIDGKTVVSLASADYQYGTGAFENHIGITSVTLPDTITTIGSSAFAGCVGLKSVTIPDSVITINSSAFYNCSGLKNISLPKQLISIGNSCFARCTGLSSIIIPDTVTKIGNSAFRECSGITSIVVPDSVTIIEDNAFSGCSGLKNITLSKNISVLPEGLFSKCSSLTSIIVPDSVTTIKGDSFADGAFYNCTNLAKILIPDSVTSIEDQAFDGCKNLTIYGNDNQASKTFAESKEINFDYIKNWNKAESGDDVIAPKVKSIVFKNPPQSYYDETKKMYILPAGYELAITVNFSEDIKGSTSPTLKIRFGDSNDISLKNGTIGGKSIIYTYKIKDTDKGTLATSSLSGGNITDVSGNKAILSCPKIQNQYNIYSEYVYANGTKSSSTTPDNTNNTTTNTNTNTSKTNNTTTNTNKNNTNTKNTTKNVPDVDELPKTGSGIAIISVIIALVAISGIYTYKRYSNLRDIK